MAKDREDMTTRVRPYRPATAHGGEHPCLEILTGGSRGKTIALAEGSLTIGRAASDDLTLDEDGVSRHHARVVMGQDVVSVADLDSTNGTYVNGVRITRIGLREGDRIQIGPDVTLRFGYRPMEGAGGVALEADEPLELSPRELEVARLVAEGLANPDIGRRLHISPRTVSTHLTNIYKRLDLHSRPELTRYLVERGLLGRKG